MFETYNTSRDEVMAITSMQAVRLNKPPNEGRRQTQNGSETQGSAGSGITMLQAEKMLKSLVEEGWFEKSRKGYYSLTPRALMELRGWLIETYNDVDEEEDENRVLRIKLCYACKEIITVVSILESKHSIMADHYPGPALSEAYLSMSSTRYLYAKLLPHAAVEEVPALQD